MGNRFRIASTSSRASSEYLSESWYKNIRMNQRPFPKPPPANPLPLETWLRCVDRAESGREAFFRGRDMEFDVFRRAANRLLAGRTGGGTMLFQGAPGAGKTALMAECMEAVRRHSTPEDPWAAVSIMPETLQSSVDVMLLLVEAVNTECGRLAKRASGAIAGKLAGILDLGRKLYGELSERGLGIAGTPVGGKPEANRDANLLSERVFRNAASLLDNLRLVVLIDEAQNIPVESTTWGVLDCLHNPPGGIPLVTAFFGLNDSQDVLRQCGLSRFADERLVNLESLSADDAASAIRDVFDAYGFMGTPEHRAAWVDSLAGLSQGWPQHINSVSVAAGCIIQNNGGQIAAECLDEAMAAAEEFKNEYYAGRLAASSRPPWVYRELALAAEANDGVLTYDELRQFTAEESMDEFLANTLHAGLLTPACNIPGHYKFPIPALGDYLRTLPVEPPFQT